MNEFIKAIIGEGTLVQLAAALFFAYLTAFAMMLFRTTKRDIESERTPFNFSWPFFFSDNAKRIYATIIFIFLAVRFSQAWIGPEYTAYAGAAIGLIGDQLGRLMESLSEKLSQNAKNKIDKI